MILPTEGKVEIYGKKPQFMKKFISYVPQENFSSPMLTGRENLMYFARLMGYSKDEAKELVSEEFLREKSVLFWIIVRPIIWVLIGSFTFVSEVKKEVIPYIGGSITVSMMTFALTLVGMANLPGI